MKGVTDAARARLAELYGLKVIERRKLTEAFMEQLARCRSDEARRVLLGTDGRGKFKRASKNLKTKKG
jgi:hypothetical protein